MSKFIKSGAIALAAATVLGAAAPSYAQIATFSTFGPTTTARNLRWEKVGVAGGKLYTIATNNGTTPGSALVSFSFLDPSLAPYVTDVTAKFTYFASVTSSPASLSAGQLFQDIGSGSFSFLTTSAITIGSTTYAAGSNLLSATFSHAVLFGSVGGTSGSVSTSTASGDTLVYSSDFLTFNTSEQDYAFGLTAINAALARASNKSSLNSFRASASGNFSATFVPEPASWALMLGGFGLIGMAARRRKTAAYAA